MKTNSAVFVSLILMLSACHDANNNLETKKQNPLLNKTIGDRIPTDEANRWIDSYRRKVNSGRAQEFQHVVTSQPFDTILSAIPLLGLAFHYGVDDAGELHVLILAVSEDEKLWSEQGDRICVDANTNSVISEAVAKKWTTNFRNTHPEETWYHFFGSDILLEMRDIPWFTEFEIVPALNDEGAAQLLLLLEGSSSSEGRIVTEVIAIDKGTLCPPCAAE